MPFELTADPTATEQFLARQGWLAPRERVLALEKAGEGNMNRTLRATTDRRSLILKQSFPWCARFPDIPAPVGRIGVEVAFYAFARREPALAERMPAILGFAEDDHVALIEDLGVARDLVGLYSGERLAAGELATLVELAHALHALPLSADDARRLRNAEMRALNHEHIFDLPLQPDNGFDLEARATGLTAVAEEARANRDYVAAVAALGRIYLDCEGPALLHGDYYPGSFLRTDRGLMLIDPEFAFPGPPEFDLSVLVAHLVFAGGEPEAVVDEVLAHYATPVDRTLVEGFAGAELMRRALGVSGLAVAFPLETLRAWVVQSTRWVAGWRNANA
ncbi:MAG: phosphotransferase [Myxococcota bacterium]